MRPAEEKRPEQPVKIAGQYGGRPLLTTDAVLVEIANALARGYKPEAVQGIDDFLNSDDAEGIRLPPLSGYPMAPCSTPHRPPPPPLPPPRNSTAVPPPSPRPKEGRARPP